MRIEIFDATNLSHSISSRNPDLLGQWLVETLSKLATLDTRYQHTRINVWPDDEEEMKFLFWEQGRMQRANSDLILQWAEHLTHLSAEMAEKELKD